MSAEFRKLVSLPTPRWTALIVLGCGLLAAVIVYFAGDGGDPEGVLGAAVGLPSWIASIVIGAWMIGVEFGQRTMRRSLSADPRRVRLVISKIAVMLGFILVLTVVAYLFCAALLALVGSPVDLDIAGKLIAAGLIQNVVYALVSFFIALLLRSMAAGMTVALAFAFVIDLALSAIPKYGDYSLSMAVTEIYSAIAGNELGGAVDDPNVLRGVLVTLAWLAVLGLASGLRFLRTDVE
jgi:ABC-2 type transport system permease protein